MATVVALDEEGALFLGMRLTIIADGRTLTHFFMYLKRPAHSRGARQQSATAQQASAALAQIEAGGVTAKKNAELANDRAIALAGGLRESRERVQSLIERVTSSLKGVEVSLITLVSC